MSRNRSRSGPAMLTPAVRDHRKKNKGYKTTEESDGRIVGEVDQVKAMSLNPLERGECYEQFVCPALVDSYIKWER